MYMHILSPRQHPQLWTHELQMIECIRNVINKSLSYPRQYYITTSTEKHTLLHTLPRVWRPSKDTHSLWAGSLSWVCGYTLRLYFGTTHSGSLSWVCDYTLRLYFGTWSQMAIALFTCCHSNKRPVTCLSCKPIIVSKDYWYLVIVN